VLAVALGVGLVLGVQLTASALAVGSQQVARDLFGAADVSVRPFARDGLRPDMVTAVASLPSVQNTALQQSRESAAEIRGRHSFLLVEGIDLVAERRFHALDLVAGGWFPADSSHEVVLPEPLANSEGLRVGDSLRLVTVDGFQTFRVSGLLAPGGVGQVNSGQAVFVSLTTARALFSLGGRVQLIEVRLRPGATVADFRRQLGPAATQDYYLLDRTSITSDPGQLLSGLEPLAVGLGLLSLLVGMLLVANTLAMEVLERRHEIGVLRAAGATSRQVGRVFRLQGLVIGALGAVAGIGVGTALAAGAAGYLGAQAGLGSVPLEFGWWQPLAIAAAGTLLTAASASLAVRRAARLAPVEALRPGYLLEPRDLPPATTLAGAVCLLAGVLVMAFAGTVSALQAAAAAVLALAFALLLPAYLRPLLHLAGLLVRPFARAEAVLGVRALARRRSRSALTVGGIGLATASLLALAGLSLSAQAESRDWIASLFVTRYLVVSPVDQPLQVATGFSSLPNVEAASPVSSFSVRTGREALPAVAVDPLEYATHAGLALLSGDRATALSALNGDAVLLPYSLAQQLGVGAGSTLPIGTDQGSVGFKVAGVVAHSLPGSSGQESAIFSQSTAQSRFGLDYFDLLQIVPRSSSLDLAAVRQAALAYGMDLVTVDQITTAVDTGLSGLTLLLQAVGAVGVAVAVLGIVNTMLVSVAEGRRELALLRSLGMTRRQLRRLVIAEAAMLGAAGAVVGVLLGALGLIGLLRATATPTLQPVLVVPWVALAIVAGGLIVAAVLAALGPARRAAAGSIVEALRVDY
jgi:putative ABC transport system permease protein